MRRLHLSLLATASLLAACSGGARTSSTTSARSNPLSSNGVNATLRVQSDWKSGYCADVTMENTSAAAVTSWTVVVDLHQSTVTNLWNGTYTTSGSQITVKPAAGTGTIAAGGSLNAFGFCGNATGSTYLPELVSLVVVGGGGGGTSDFALSANPAGGTLPQGSSGSSTITIDRSGYTGSVALTASGLPAGVTASFDPATTTGTTSTLAVAVSWSAAPGTSTVTVTGTGGGITRAVQLALTVSGNGTSDFALSANPAGGTLPQGASGSSTISIDRSGYTGSVALTVSGVPAGVTATLDPATTTGTTSTLAVAVSSSAAPGTSTLTVTGTGGGITRTAQLALTVSGSATTNAYTQRFLDLYAQLHGNGYFSPEGVPYHSVETLMCEAPDYGHETTSETFSYWVWLEAMYGNVTGTWSGLQKAFDTMETYIVPTQADQPTNSFYNPSDRADYAPEWDQPSQYPALIDANIKVGADPIANELKSTYGTADIYGMHWLLDVDNWYGYGRRGDGTSHPSYINTFQRGPQESVWETVPHPSWEDFQWGAGSAGGFLPLFITGPAPAKQWRYTNAPDADARLVQAMYWARVFADERGGNATVDALTRKAAKMGDYLRYAMFDKYFKTMGCASSSCTAGTGYDAAHYLMSWYYAWGGPTDSSGGWAWRIGCSHNHFGYQNPMAAYALSAVSALKPQSPNAARDWNTSLGRQLEFYRWLQSADGAIAGGATNSWGGHYAAPPAGTPTFYAMSYDWAPVYRDPPSSDWFGFQAWSMERVAEYYYVTGDAKAKLILDRWIAWAKANTRLLDDGTYEIPSKLSSSGQPSTNWNASTQNWSASDASFNSGLRITVVETTQDVGVAAALAKALTYYSAGTARWATQDVASQTLARELLDRMWTKYRDAIGVSVPEVRQDYDRFDDPIYVPSSYSGEMKNGDPIDSSSTFLGIRSKYKSDPDWSKVQDYLNGGAVPSFRYHRFWAQADIALANAEYGRLFGE
jgi:hypothetical protein